MKIFALETDVEKLYKSFLSADESILVVIRFHGFVFVMRCIVALFYTLILASLGVGLWFLTIPALWVSTAFILLWFPLIGWSLLGAYIDWHYDVLLVTTEKIVYVNQSSIFHQEIRQMNLENIASVKARTQFWNLFPFGTICFDLKEGVGVQMCLSYIPQAARVTSIISDAVTLYQRRRAAG